MSTQSIPSVKTCECGCGLAVSLSSFSDANRGYRLGQPVRFIPGHNMKAIPFWDRVFMSANDDACWPWMGGKKSGNYGAVKFQGKSTAAHRVAFILAFGPIPEGLLVCHECDNPPCCRPSHLFLGTVGDNNIDKELKGRGGHIAGEVPYESRRRGDKHPMVILNSAQVIEIRSRNVAGESQSSLAREFKVHLSTVHLIVKRKNWTHLQ